MRVSIYLLIVLLFCLKVSAQNQSIALDLLSKTKEALSNTKSVDLEYILKDKETDKTIEKYKGIVSTKGSTRYTKISTTEIVTTATNELKIDHKNKMMLLVSIAKSQSKVDVTQQLLTAKNYHKVVERDTVIDRKNQYEIVMVTGMYTGAIIDKVHYFIDKENYIIKKQSFEYTNPIEYTVDNPNKRLKVTSGYPVLEITYKVSEKPIKVVPTLDSFIEQRLGKYVPIKKYKNYKLIQQ